MNCPDCGQPNLAGEETCANCSASLVGLPGEPPPQDALSEKVLQSRIGDLKPRAAICVPPSASISEAVLLMRKERIGCVLALDGTRLGGILTERDLLRRLPEAGDPETLAVRDLMNPIFVCLKADDPLSYALHYMALGGYRHLPIRQGDNSLALLSARDVLRYLAP